MKIEHDDDARLLAYTCDALDQDARDALEAELEHNAALRARLEALMREDALLDALLPAADPLDPARLEAILAGKNKTLQQAPSHQSEGPVAQRRGSVMRIVCDSCGTKYSISDDKVRGKVFKIRCKKCSDVIVVRGDAGQEDAGAASGDAGAAWYVVLGGAQDGPHTVEAVRGYLQSGDITPDTFVWREGVADWLRLAEAEGLSHLVHELGGGYTNGHSDMLGFGAEPGSVETGAAAARGGGVASVAAPDPTPGGFASERLGAMPAASPDLSAGFGGALAASVGGQGVDRANGHSDPLGGELHRTPADPREAPIHHEPMVGERNENSVLFSLSSLQAIKVEEKKPKNTDQSGLIDIHALSSSAAAVSSQRADDGLAPGPMGGGVDPFSAAGVGPAIAVPVMMPMGTRRSNVPLFAGIGVAALLVVGLIVVILVLVLSKGDQPPTTIVKEAPAGQTAPVSPSADTPGTPAGALAVNTTKDDEDEDEDKGREDEGEDEDKDKDEAADEDEDDKVGRRSGNRRSKRDRRSRGGAVAAAGGGGAKTNKRDTAPPPEEDKRKKRGGNDNIDNILDDIAGGGGSKKKAPPKEVARKDTPAAPSGGAGGAKLSRTQVQGTIRRYYSKINGCGSAQAGGKVSGTITVRFTIQPNGSVGSASVTSGKFRGKPVAGCVQRVVRSMKFPKSGQSMTINYPFSLR